MTRTDALLTTESSRAQTLISCAFAPPFTTGDTVSRARLLHLMERAVRRPVTTVSGEPASGKTTVAVDLLGSRVVADWLVAWLALPHQLDDEFLFWRYLLAALEPLDIFTDDLASRLADGEPPDDEWLIVLAHRLADVPRDLVVVIDDLHELDNPRAFTALWSVLERVPPLVHFVLLSRSKPAWPLSEWKMSGRLEEIVSADLRFTSAELHHLVTESPDVHLSDDAIAPLLARTEGWAGGIKLAMLSMRRASTACLMATKSLGGPA